MNWVFPDVEAIKLVQADLIDTYGGSHGIRDAGLLESAVMRAEMKVRFEESPSVAAVAASLAFGLIKNHAFIDGNKRIGLSALVNFLLANGHRLAASQAEQHQVVQATAASEISEADWMRWVEAHVRRVQQP